MVKHGDYSEIIHITTPNYSFSKRKEESTRHSITHEANSKRRRIALRERKGQKLKNKKGKMVKQKKWGNRKRGSFNFSNPLFVFFAFLTTLDYRDKHTHELLIRLRSLVKNPKP